MKSRLTQIRIRLRPLILAIAAMMTLALGASAQPTRLQPNQQLDYRSLFAVVGTMYNIDPQLLSAIARVESAGNPNAISSAGAVGLMQLEPPTAAEFARLCDTLAWVHARSPHYRRVLDGAGIDQRLLQVHSPVEGPDIAQVRS
jgi:hypothetical protein